MLGHRIKCQIIGVKVALAEGDTANFSLESGLIVFRKYKVKIYYKQIAWVFC
jgi:hypothetical protein